MSAQPQISPFEARKEGIYRAHTTNRLLHGRGDGLHMRPRVGY